MPRNLVPDVRLRRMCAAWALLWCAGAATIAEAEAPESPAENGGLQVGAAAGAVLAVGLLPTSIPAPELRGELAVPRGPSAVLALTFFPPSSENAIPGGEFYAFSGSIGGCTPRWGRGRRLTIAGCVTAMLGAIRAAGTGVDHPYARLAPLISFGGYVDLSLEIAPRFGISLRLGGEIPAVRPTFIARIDGDKALVHQPWPVIPFVALDLYFAERG